MPDFIDRLSAELVRAASAQPSTSQVDGVRDTPGRSRLVAWRKPLIAVIGALGFIAAPALAITQPWNPQPRQIVEPNGSHSGTSVPTASVTMTNAAPPAQQLSSLSVLRRAPSELDHTPAVQRALEHLFGGISGVEINYVRALYEVAGAPLVVLVPAESWSGPQGPHGSYFIHDPLCVEIIPASGTGSAGSCEPTSALTSGNLTGSLGSFEYSVVPDGVTDVVLHFPNGSVETDPVRDNVVTFTAPQGASSSAPATFPKTIEWLDRAGRIVPKTS